MSFNPPPPPPPPGDSRNPGEVPGYPGASQVPSHLDPPPPPYSGEQTSPYTAPPQYPATGDQGMPPPPPQYVGGQYAGGMQQTLNHPNATVILIMGILGLIFCAPLGIPAWVMGNNALKEIDRSGQFYENRGTVQAGRIIGIIATIFLILQVVAVVFILGLGGFAIFLEGAAGY